LFCFTICLVVCFFLFCYFAMIINAYSMYELSAYIFVL
jgi:hypothetical protein